MIMRGTNRRALSAAGLLVVLGLGAVLLPLRPTWAQTGSAPQSDDSRQDQPAAPDPETFQQQINKACQVVEQAKAQVDVQKAQLALAEAALKQAEENLTQSLSRANYVKRKVGLPADQRGQVLKGATTKRAPARRTIKIEVREEKGQPVIRVQDEVVELADLTKILSRYVQKRGEIEFLLDAGNNVNFRTVVAIQS